MFSKTLMVTAIAASLTSAYWVSSETTTASFQNEAVDDTRSSSSTPPPPQTVTMDEQTIDLDLELTTTSPSTPLASNARQFNSQNIQKHFPQKVRSQNSDDVLITHSPKQPLIATTADDARELILSSGKQHLNIQEQDNLLLKSAKRDQKGNAIYKYTQTYEDIPVFGREMVVQINPQSEVSLIGGQFESSINLETQPSMTPKTAMDEAFSSFTETPTDTPTVLEQPELVIYTNETIEPTLTYRVVIEYMTIKSGYKKEEVFINAHSGQPVNQITKIHSALNYTIHSIDDQCMSQNSNSLPGREIDASDGDHAEGVDTNSKNTYNFFNKMFGRDSWDGNGRKIVSTIHARFQGSNGCSGDNAYFTGDQMVFGDGSDKLSNPGAAKDIFGHEFAHGFTASESNLTYQNQSGAINEAVSDIMGSGAQAWIISGGSASNNPSSWTTNDAVWTMGDGHATGSFLRYMDDPEENGSNKDDYNDRYTGTQDNGGVHINSGIMNLAFYLVSEGGTHPRGNTSNNVTEIGIEKALQIYYYANNNLFTSSTSFESARTKLATAAKTLYSCDEWESVHQSYDAVNVPGSRGDECDTGGGDGGSNGDGSDGGDGGGTPPPTGDNIALGSAYQASTTYSNSYNVARSTDGNASTQWVSRTIYNAYNAEYVQMNLGSSQSFSSMNIDWNGADSASSISAWVWNGSRWAMVGESSGSPATSINFSKQNAQYVMLKMRYGNRYRWYAIDEISVQ